jgi:hypothetical protein
MTREEFAAREEAKLKIIAGAEAWRRWYARQCRVMLLLAARKAAWERDLRAKVADADRIPLQK